MIHRINIFLICIFVALNPIFLINSANASTVGGWNLSNPIAQGASTLYNGAKNVIINGKNVAKTSTALVTPVAKDVAKLLGKGVAGVALSVAVEQLIGAVDWVLDPANNQVKYRVPVCPDGSTDCAGKFLYQAKWDSKQTDFHNTQQQSCTATAKLVSTRTSGDWRFSNKYYNGSCIIDLYSNDKVVNTIHVSIVSKPNSNAEEQEKTLPLDTVARQVISNAETGNADAKVATTAAAADIVNDAQNDSTKARPIVNQLEANAETATDESASAESKPKDPAKPEVGSDLSIEFPVFCGWAPTICEAATTVIRFPTTLTEWWETSTTAISEAWVDVKDWVKTEEPVERETKVDLEVPVPPELPSTNYLQWNAYCPFNSKSDQVTIGGETTSIDSDLSSWCTMASEVRPFVLMAGAIASLMIVSGVSMRGDD